MKYYIKLDDEIRGPFSVEHVRQRIAEKAYQASDLVRLEDGDDWTTLGDMPEFSQVLAPLAPLSNPLAKRSLILGFASPILMILATYFENSLLFLLYLITGIAAIICGHLAIRKIMRSFHDMEGYRMAKASLWVGYTIVIIYPVFYILVYMPLFYHPPQGKITLAINNCKQIIISLRLYADDHDGKYPDFMVPNARNSNEAFRLLFKEGVLETESIFGCGLSPYKPDGNIGTAPDFLEAVKAGENHWAMTKGLTDAWEGSLPLVFENPSDASWPPGWNVTETKEIKAIPGRAWSGGKVIIGFNDSSIEVLELEKNKGPNVRLKPMKDGKLFFPPLNPKLEILNVAK
ncbi:MAG: hypothetical protein RL693_760 [Verrucomicrobiota bacterium]|jgi:hypothetical protein